MIVMQKEQKDEPTVATTNLAVGDTEIERDTFSSSSSSSSSRASRTDSSAYHISHCPSPHWSRRSESESMVFGCGGTPSTR